MSQISLENINDGGHSYSLQELIATTLAHHLQDGEIVATGAASALARAACRLAQLTHAPNLSYVAGGSGAINPELSPLVASSGDYTNLICESVLPLSELVGRLAQSRLDVFIASGLQIDKFGNVNLSLVPSADPAKPILRGPGGALLPMFANAGRIIYFFLDHSPRTFVEKVSFRTAPGFLEGAASWQQAKAAGLYPGNGPALVVSALGVMDFEPESKAMRLLAVHPGVTLDQIKRATGFELLIPPRGAYTTVPSEAELQILRDLDENKILH
jgi:glutaconate CoA-transferase subunit B